MIESQDSETLDNLPVKMIQDLKESKAPEMCILLVREGLIEQIILCQMVLETMCIDRNKYSEDAQIMYKLRELSKNNEQIISNAAKSELINLIINEIENNEKFDLSHKLKKAQDEKIQDEIIINRLKIEKRELEEKLRSNERGKKHDNDQERIKLQIERSIYEQRPNSNEEENKTIKQVLSIQINPNKDRFEIFTHNFSFKEPSFGSWSLLKPEHMNEQSGYVKYGKMHVTVKLEKIFLSVQIVDWSNDKYTRDLNMRINLDKNDDYDQISSEVAKAIQKYKQQEEIKERKIRLKERKFRKLQREQKQKDREQNDELVDLVEIQQEKDEEEKDKFEEDLDFTTPLPTISKSNILLSREKDNGKFADINPNNRHITAEMMIFPAAFSRVDFSKLTGGGKISNVYRYQNLVDISKLSPEFQKPLFYEILPIDVHSYFTHNNIINFRICDQIQRSLYIEKYFVYQKDGTVANILSSIREMFIKKPPNQHPRNEIQHPYINIQSTLQSKYSSSQSSSFLTSAQSSYGETIDVQSSKFQQVKLNKPSLFPHCIIYRPCYQLSAKRRQMLVQLTYSISQTSEEKIKFFKKFGFQKDEENENKAGKLIVKNKEEKEKAIIELINISQYLLDEELIPSEEIFQIANSMNQELSQFQSHSQTQSQQLSQYQSQTYSQSKIQSQFESQSQITSPQIICILPFRVMLIDIKDINLVQLKTNCQVLSTTMEGNKINVTKTKKLRVDIIAKDPLFRCTLKALKGGEQYEKICEQEIQKQNVDLIKEKFILIPVYYVDPNKLKREIHTSKQNQKQDSISLTFPEDTFMIRVRENDTIFDVVLSMLLARGMIMTIEEAMNLNVWIEDSTFETIPLCEINKDAGIMFKFGLMLLIGKEI